MGQVWEEIQVGDIWLWPTDLPHPGLYLVLDEYRNDDGNKRFTCWNIVKQHTALMTFNKEAYEYQFISSCGIPKKV